MASAIDLWQEADGRWRWAYKENGLEIMSNHPYATMDAAVEAASIAYPDVPIAALRRDLSSDDVSTRPSLATLLLMIIAVWRWYRRARSS